MKILITGSSGQIGTNLALRLLDEGHTVLGVDNRINTWTDRINTYFLTVGKSHHSSSGWIGSLAETDFDVCVHLAAHAKVHESVKSPRIAFLNSEVTFEVLEYCRETMTPIIFSSTREVYGDINRFHTEESQANHYTESPYSAGKIADEARIYAYAKSYGLRYLVFRLSNVYGRYDNDLDRMERVIPLFIKKISNNEPVTIYGPKVLDFTYVDDCVDGLRSGIDYFMGGGRDNHTINLAYGMGHSLTYLANLIGAVFMKKPVINMESPRVGEVTHYVADISKAKEILGYRPKTNLDEGISKAVHWCMDWWANHE